MAWAYKNKIVAGISTNLFAPNQPVTREQICVLLKNYIQYKGLKPEKKNTNTTIYADAMTISDWAYPAVYQMQSLGYLIGDNNNCFRPLDQATRGECAAVFARLCGYFYDSYKSVTPVVTNPTPSAGTFLGVFKSTFYCPCDECSCGYGRNTATGAIAQQGVTIAVDFSVIPRNSKVYVEFSEPRLQHLNGYYYAQDCGGGVNGNHIDVFVDNHELAKAYGVDYGVKVYLVK